MKKSQIHLPDREAIVSGRFYPGSHDALSTEIDELSGNADKLGPFSIEADEELLALISPHAGYVFSGTVAASAFNVLRKIKDKKRIFLIGSSHTSFYNAASVYYEGSYLTPLGKVKIDHETAASLLVHDDVFEFHREAHIQEHSLEVQLPFLQKALHNDFMIVPILLGSHSKEVVEKLAVVLQPYFGIRDNIFIVSTDLSHYPSYNDAMKIDKLTVDAVCSNDPEKFLEQIHSNDTRQIPNLSTSMCGWTSTLTLLYLTQAMEGISYRPILYQNSGDVALYGDKHRVVGYQSIAVLIKKKDKNTGFRLSEDEKKALLTIARTSIRENLDKGHKASSSLSISESLNRPLGAFVSLYVDGDLRGCIGRISTDDALYKTVERMSVASASSDSRFNPIRKDELDRMKIEISILTPLKKINSPDEIVPGKHGIMIRKDYTSGTFLPQVAQKTGWDALELLSQCSDRKAGLGRDGWKDAELFTYEALIFSDIKDQST